MKKILIILFSTCVVLGCAAMSDMAGFGIINEEKSTFDNATIIRMSPDAVWEEGNWTGVPVNIGARWTSNAPDFVVLILEYNSSMRYNSLSTGSYSNLYRNFSGLDVNIDGEIYSFETEGSTVHNDSGYNSISKTTYTQSVASVIVPLGILKGMLEAEDCRLRFHTSKGYIDAQFSIEKIPGGLRTAIVPMREFMDRVEAKL